jgi:hypothetical protein
MLQRQAEKDTVVAVGTLSGLQEGAMALGARRPF